MLVFLALALARFSSAIMRSSNLNADFWEIFSGSFIPEWLLIVFFSGAPLLLWRVAIMRVNGFNE